MKEEYKEVKLKCEYCGKIVKRVLRKDSKTTKFLCQQCAKKLTETE